MKTLYRNQREVKPLNLTFTSATTGLPYDISSSTIYFTVKTIKDSVTADTAAVISKTEYVSSGTSGEVTIAITESDTNINPQTYVYDIWKDNLQIGEGKFIILQPVTNRV